MRTLDTIRIVSFLSFLLCGSIISGAFAEPVEGDDGIYYDHDSDSAWVIGCRDWVTHIEIPDEITISELSGYSYRLPVSHIKEGAFRNNQNITYAFINSKRILKDAFMGCSNLTTLEVWDNVEYIGKSAFWGCTSLELLALGHDSDIALVIDDGAFMYCTGLKFLDLGKNVRLHQGAFFGCLRLETLNLSEGIKTIGSDAFSFCVSLTSVDIPSTVETIGVGAFSADSSLVHVGFQEGLKNIGEMAFALCYSLNSIDIPKSVESIGNSAFGACYNVASINVASGSYYYDSRDNCNAIIEKASKTLIAGCINTVIPNTVVNIAKNAFNRVGFESILFPNSVVNIGETAFYKCNKLNDVKIGSSVKNIAKYAFRDCSNLQTVTLGRSVEKIYAGAFMGCPILTVTSLNPTAPLWADNPLDYDDIFNEEVYSGTLYIPKGSYSSYNAFHPQRWNWFQEIIEIDLSADVNDDGEVNIADINTVIDCILKGNQISTSDVNCDGEVNIADINVIIDCILKG